jgi:D-amino-acid oxidase
VVLAAVVVGAGVSGLTTAVCLAEAGVEVHVVAEEPPLATTSAAAGAMWDPYLVESRQRVRTWSLRTLNELRRLAAVADAGVKLLNGIEASRTAAEPPIWADIVEDMRPCAPTEMPTGFVVGWRFSAPLIDMPTYLVYLVDRLAAAGGTIEIGRVTALNALASEWPIVVNCTGIGARDLVPDPSMEPIRGQLVVTDNPGIQEFFTEDTGLAPELCHIHPHGDHVVLGGTAERGSWSRDPVAETAEHILDRCRQVEPRLNDVTVLEHRVGLRPTTPTIQLRTEHVGNATLIHNYGHGGAGVTLSWGCAYDVAQVVTTRLP